MPTDKYKTVPDFMASLPADKREQVQVLRQLILDLGYNLEEHIKWNAPSYVLDGEDRITFNVVNKDNHVKLVIHMGATRKEDKHGKPVLSNDHGIVQWSSDIRGYITFSSLEDVASKSSAVKQVLSDWLEIA